MSWKRILRAGGILFLVLMGGLYILLSTYDYDGLKPQIAEAVRDATGRELALGGKISLKFGLSPDLVVGNIAFQNAPWALQPDMVKVKRLEIQVALLPLILGHIDVKRFVLIEPEIPVETDPSGRSNLSFKTTGALGKTSGKTTPPNGGQLKLRAPLKSQGASQTPPMKSSACPIRTWSLAIAISPAPGRSTCRESDPCCQQS
jgi:uncharacterized protein involved in outer membrane biogenesis